MTQNLINLPSTSQLVQQHQLITKKNLGQNFIFDHNFTRKIVNSTGNLEQQLVLEIGPGPGCLTRSILEQPIKELICIEKDARCLPILTQIQQYFPKLTFFNEDALLIDENHLFNKQKFKIIANLPYNIGTVLIFKWLKNLTNIISMHLMLQKEVAERIVAQPNTKNYCRLSANINLLCQTKILYLVHKNIFTPPPKVTSAIIEIIPRDQQQLHLISDGCYFNENFSQEKYQLVVNTAFNQPRKMLRQSLKNILPPNLAEKTLENLNINPCLRAENLSIADFCKISLA
jgi:16S rRNA (adenine1518-N6/adenine1519-N6)-dimethyltransferase